MRDCSARFRMAPKLKPKPKLVDSSWTADEPGTQIQDRTVVLFLPPHEVEEDIEEWYARLPACCTPLFGKKMHLVRADPPFQDDDPDGIKYYLKPSKHRDVDARRKEVA